MARVKGALATRKRRKKTLKLAKGYREVRHKHIKAAREAVIHSMTYSHRDRIVNKRNFRKLWIIRINAAARINGMTYSTLISGLKAAGAVIDRKVLAEIAVTDPKAFAKYVELAKNAVKA